MQKIIALFLLLHGVSTSSPAADEATAMMTHCCTTGTHLNDCTDSGINAFVVNAPSGLCRDTMKFCCSLAKNPQNCAKNFHARFAHKCRGGANEPTTCCDGCRIGKHLAKLNHSCEEIPLANLSRSTAQMIAKCCAEASQPQGIKKRLDAIACKVGYRWNSKAGKCEDIDECKITNNGCYEKTQKCENLVGGYRCLPRSTCRDGFEFDADALECRQWRALGVDFEASLVRSEELVSDCTSGMRWNETTRVCEDINECREQKGVCDQVCVNTVGSYYCKCRRGYRSHGNVCEDIDECEAPNPCSHHCFNVRGSFKCKCPNGMRIGIDKRTCEDIDECVEMEGICGDKLCRNLVGSYVCGAAVDCPEHYKPHLVVGGRNTTKCVRTPCEDAACKALPKYLIYKTLRFPADLQLPPTGVPVYNIRTKSLKFEVDFEMTMKVLPKENFVRTASINDFSIKMQPTRSLVMLTKPLEGPQDVILKLNMLNKGKGKVMEAIEIKIIVDA